MRYDNNKEKTPSMIGKKASGSPSLLPKSRKGKMGDLFKTSVTLIDNLRGLPLSEAEGVSVERYTIDDKGKPVEFSNFESKVLTFLGELLSNVISKEDTQKAIKFLTFENLEDKGKTCVERKEYIEWNAEARPPVSVDVSLQEVVKELFPNSPDGGKQTDDVQKALLGISQRRQLWRFRDNRTKKVIELNIRPVDVDFISSKDARGKNTTLRIRYGDMWLYQLNSRYVLAPSNTLSLWNKAEGSNTLLFKSLLFQLVYERGLRVNGTRGIKAIEGAFRKEHSKHLSEEEQKELERLKTERLTYNISLSTICKKIPQNPYSFTNRGKEGFRKKRAKEDLLKAATALKDTIRIIKDFYYTEEKGEIKCFFVINENWTEETDTAALPEKKEPTK